MKKRIFAIIALAATLAGCSKEVSENPSPVVEGQKLVITATVGEPATRLGYTENDKNGFTAKFTSSEKISLYFLKADNTVALSRTLSVDSYSISDDGKSAKFETTDLTIPSDAVKLAAYLYSGSGSTYTDEKVTDDLSTQANLNAAQSHHILYAAANTSDIKTGEDGVAVANLKFAYKTALLRFTLTLPEGVKATLDDKTKVTLSTPDNSVHNALDIVWGELAESSVKGDIVAYPTDTVKVGNVAVVYACVWAADNFKDSKITVAQGDDTYSVNLELKKETLEAGKVYDVKRTLTVAPVPVSMWANDEAGSADFKYSGGEDLTNDWLSCKSGKVSWSTNTTGAPRSAKLTFKNGATFELTQVVPADFKGSWSFTSKTFAGTGALVAKADSKTLDVTFADPRNTEALKDVDGTTTRTNNIGIKGLYGETVLDACVDIDYTAMTARVGLFLDTRDGIGQEVSGKYATYFPGLATRTDVAWAKPWIYSETELGDPDYVWMWFTVSEDFKTVMYENRTNDNCELQALTQYKNTTMNQICGFGVVLSGSNVFNNTTVTGYANFFQLNPAGSKGEFFARK